MEENWEPKYNYGILNHSRNFTCKLTNSGKWRLEEEETFGKWLLLCKPKGNNTCLTFTDQRDIITGLLECERRNDLFRIEHNSKAQLKDTIRKFRLELDIFERNILEGKQVTLK